MAVISSNVCTDSGSVNNAGQRAQSKRIHGRRQKQCALRLHGGRLVRKMAQEGTGKGLQKYDRESRVVIEFEDKEIVLIKL